MSSELNQNLQGLDLARVQWSMDIGASVVDPKTVLFRAWAPYAGRLSVKILSETDDRVIPLKEERHGYFSGIAGEVSEGDRYVYCFPEGREYPDPASRLQPEGVHGPSQVVDPGKFSWSDKDWAGVLLKDFVIYELHAGTFTREGTFMSIIPCLAHLKDLGITAIELMPVNQFPGRKNWGYDGVYPFAPQNTYGGPLGLKSFINACHREGMSVILDVVYNHLGPEGNYLGQFGPYFTERYRTPWGAAINYDGPHSDEVRHYFVSNALYWISEYHVDALRIDAIHGIYDFSAKHILQEIGDAVHGEAKRQNRNIYVIPESDLNDARVIRSKKVGGFGLDAQWNDDFHHALHTLVTGERDGYYQDFGSLKHLVKAFKKGFVYSGQYSRFRMKRHGNSTEGILPHQFVVFSQNHDQVGNRMLGDRLSKTQAFEKLKLTAGVVMLSPFIPLLFMGEEYGETAPFCYFTDHSDENLIQAVRKGRMEEFSRFGWQGELPDPQAETTFLSSKIDLQGAGNEKGPLLVELYRALIEFRKQVRSSGLFLENVPVVKGFTEERVLLTEEYIRGNGIFVLFSFNEKISKPEFSIPGGSWMKVLDTSSSRWGGERPEVAPQEIVSAGARITVEVSPWSAVVYMLGRTAA